MSMERYSIKGVYKMLCGEVERVDWDNVVWNRNALPKHRFFMWLTMKQRMHTMEKMYRVGVSSDPLCLISGLENESQDHLFFSCRYSMTVMEKINSWLQLGAVGMTVPRLLRLIKSSGFSQMQKKVMLAVIATTIYQIWNVRNKALWNQKVTNVDSLVNSIQKMVIERVYSALPRRIYRKDREWMRQRCLDVCN